MHLFFSTPIWATKVKDYEKVNDEMLAYILNLQKKDPIGVVKVILKDGIQKILI